jgi:hypothetical protein
MCRSNSQLHCPDCYYFVEPSLIVLLQLIAHLHASLGDELTDASSISKLQDSAQVC